LVLLLGALGFVVLYGKFLPQDFELLVLRLDLLLKLLRNVDLQLLFRRLLEQLCFPDLHQIN
jgi:hypothetical protein